MQTTKSSPLISHNWAHGVIVERVELSNAFIEETNEDGKRYLLQRCGPSSLVMIGEVLDDVQELNNILNTDVNKINITKQNEPSISRTA